MTAIRYGADFPVMSVVVTAPGIPATLPGGAPKVPSAFARGVRELLAALTRRKTVDCVDGHKYRINALPRIEDGKLALHVDVCVFDVARGHWAECLMGRLPTSVLLLYASLRQAFEVWQDGGEFVLPEGLR